MYLHCTLSTPWEMTVSAISSFTDTHEFDYSGVISMDFIIYNSFIRELTKTGDATYRISRIVFVGNFTDNTTHQAQKLC